MRKSKLLLLILAGVALPLWSAGAQQLRALTEQFPPYSYEEQGRIGGVSVDVVQEIGRVAGLEVEIEVLSWSRAYRQARRQENVLLFSVGRTPERENDFQWIGPIVPYLVSFYGYGDTPPVIRSWSDLRTYRIGVVRGDLRDQYLRAAGGFQLQRFRNSQTMLRALASGDIDLAPVADLNLPYFLEFLELNPVQFPKVYPSPELSHDGLYLVTGRQTSPAIVARLRHALEHLHSSGYIDQKYTRSIHGSR